MSLWNGQWFRFDLTLIAELEATTCESLPRISPETSCVSLVQFTSAVICVSVFMLDSEMALRPRSYRPRAVWHVVERHYVYHRSRMCHGTPRRELWPLALCGKLQRKHDRDRCLVVRHKTYIRGWSSIMVEVKRDMYAITYLCIRHTLLLKTDTYFKK